MRKQLFIFGILAILFGASVVPSISGTIEEPDIQPLGVDVKVDNDPTNVLQTRDTRAASVAVLCL